jgi:hypothetical protein
VRRLTPQSQATKNTKISKPTASIEIPMLKCVESVLEVQEANCCGDASIAG